jgi:hypothetical protein
MKFITPEEFAKSHSVQVSTVKSLNPRPGQVESGHQVFVFEDLSERAQNRVMMASDPKNTGNYAFSWPFYVYDIDGLVMTNDAGVVLKLATA